MTALPLFAPAREQEEPCIHSMYEQTVDSVRGIKQRRCISETTPITPRAPYQYVNRTPLTTTTTTTTAAAAAAAEQKQRIIAPFTMMERRRCWQWRQVLLGEFGYSTNRRASEQAGEQALLSCVHSIGVNTAGRMPVTVFSFHQRHCWSSDNCASARSLPFSRFLHPLFRSITIHTQIHSYVHTYKHASGEN